MSTDTLQKRLGERIVILDGGMGMMIQREPLEEADFRGGRFADAPGELFGNNDLLNLTRPDVIERLHRGYLEAGAELIETNTFNANRISQADYAMESVVGEINAEGARIARRAADAAAEETGEPRRVVGVLGPTNRTASLSPDVNDPSKRNIRFPELVGVYREAAEALVDGGVDLIMVETIFDTLNGKAALYALDDLFEARGTRLPVMISATITDASGRTLSGQTVEGFWNSVRHARPFSVGLNCALSAEQLRQYVEELGRVAEVPVSAHPNAGLPNELGEYDQSEEAMGMLIAEWGREGLVNIIGGCCGTTPEHIAAIVKAVRGVAPRELPQPPQRLRLSGLEPLNVGPETNFVNVGERTNVTGSAKFRRLIEAEDYETALEVARQQVEDGAQVIDVNMDDGLLDGVACMRHFLDLVATEPDIARVPVMIDSSRWEILEAGLECLQGRAIVNSLSMKEGEASFLDQARPVRRFGAAVIVMALDEEGQAETVESLADRLAEAFAEYLHLRVRREWWGYDPDESLSSEDLIAERYKGIRPAPGYPACPEHTGKALIWQLLDVERQTGMRLTGNFAMDPGASVSGFYIAHPEARCFGLGNIQRDQVVDYAERKGWSIEEAEAWLTPNLAYDPEKQPAEALSRVG